MKPKTWAELEAEGVKRCCAMFKGGGRCRNRVDPSKPGHYGWCVKHGPIMDAWTKHALDVTKAMSRKENDE